MLSTLELIRQSFRTSKYICILTTKQLSAGITSIRIVRLTTGFVRTVQLDVLIRSLRSRFDRPINQSRRVGRGYTRIGRRIALFLSQMGWREERGFLHTPPAMASTVSHRVIRTVLKSTRQAPNRGGRQIFPRRLD